jgi:hypothetical protein
VAVSESPNLLFHGTAFIFSLALVVLYFFGVWSRTYVYPAGSPGSIRQQLVAGIPVALITVGAYAKTALPTLELSNRNMVFDVIIMAGYIVFVGMISREALDKMVAHFRG